MTRLLKSNLKVFLNFPNIFSNKFYFTEFFPNYKLLLLTNLYTQSYKYDNISDINTLLNEKLWTLILCYVHTMILHKIEYRGRQTSFFVLQYPYYNTISHWIDINVNSTDIFGGYAYRKW